MICPSCGTENESRSTYCGECGKSLTAEVERTSDSVSQTEDRQEDRIQSRGLGDEVTTSRRSWKILIAAVVGIFVALAVVELASGRYVNSALLTSLGILAGWIVSIAIKGKWEYATVVVVSLLVLIPVLFLAIFPWQDWYDDYEESRKAPLFVPNISYRIEDGTHIIVDGQITNKGSLGGVAYVSITAYGGFPKEGQDVFGAWRQGRITTPWIPPGGTTTIHWECTLSYFNGGQVTWTVEPTLD